VLLDARFAQATVSTTYRADQREQVVLRTNENVYGYPVQTRLIHTFVTYPVPLAYDPYSLDAAGRRQRISQNEMDAARPELPAPVIQSLWEERDHLLAVSANLGESLAGPTSP
jgi:hypothetical protein